MFSLRLDALDDNDYDDNCDEKLGGKLRMFNYTVFVLAYDWMLRKMSFSLHEIMLQTDVQKIIFPRCCRFPPPN